MKNLGNILKRKSDLLNYELCELSNQLKVVYIEETQIKKSFAVLNVKVGSFYDPQAFQGLAHFLEHMLFMGSDKYPQVDTYTSFIENHGGEYNAETGVTDTQYYHSINSDKFLKSLDMFASYFINPLLSQKYIEKEIKSVHSEFEKNLNDDDLREYQLIYNISHPQSLCNKFFDGNFETLQKPGIRQALIDFYKKSYSSNLMTLVLYHNQPFNEVKQNIIDIFGLIEN